MKKFFEKQDNIQVYDYAFGTDLLVSLFGADKYMRKYSKTGDGIYNLLFIDNKIYELKLKSVTKMLVDDGKKAFRDETKDYIVDTIKKFFYNNNIEITSNSGKIITFPHFNYIFSVEIVKKTAIPE